MPSNLHFRQADRICTFGRFQGVNLFAEDKTSKGQEVKTLLNTYFEDQWDHDGTSHIVVRCEKLKTLPDYKPFGEISVPVKGGQKVKGYYIRTLIKAINDLREGENI